MKKHTKENWGDEETGDDDGKDQEVPLNESPPLFPSRA